MAVLRYLSFLALFHAVWAFIDLERQGGLHIPTITIAEGVQLPMVGIGTWLYNDTIAEQAVSIALRGRERESFFVTSKIEGGLSYDETIAHHKENIQNLNISYVDLLLIHFPGGMMADHPEGSKDMRQAQWKAMEKLVEMGLTRSIGVSHFCPRHLEDIFEIAQIKPAVNQVQYHVGMGRAGINATDDQYFDSYHGVTYQSFSPLCGPCGTKELINGPLVTDIGAKYNKTGAQVSLKWQVQQGIPIIPKSSTEKHIRENLDMFDWELSFSDMLTLTNQDKPGVAGGGPGSSGDCDIP
ncbi:hypothetical protein AAMO2058_000375300 [Amorphochlora amoebiformis]